MDLELMTTFMATLVVLGVIGAGAAYVSSGVRAMLLPGVLQVAAIVVVLATLSSLYFSGIEGLIPCRYCWWQRIFMYPLAVVLPIAAWRKDDAVRWYAVPLAVIGAAISARHVWIQTFPDDGGSCDVAAPCSVKLVEAYGFFTIPRMTGLTFLIILLLLLVRPNSAPEDPS